MRSQQHNCIEALKCEELLCLHSGKLLEDALNELRLNHASFCDTSEQ